MELDERWAYRARAVDELVEVEVVRFGTSRPSRVLFKFVAEVMEGREEWVPPARLKVIWAEVEQFRNREARWHAVSAESPKWDDHMLQAVTLVRMPSRIG